jgi:hypothetical protein
MVSMSGLDMALDLSALELETQYLLFKLQKDSRKGRL